MAGTRLQSRVGCAAALLLVVSGAACDSPVSERMIDLDATGSARITLFLDNNLDGAIDQSDSPIENGAVVFRRVGAVADSIVLVTDAEGSARTGTLGVGRYVATIAPSVRGDTLISALDTAFFDVLPNDTADVQLGVQYPELDIQEFRDLPTGRRAWIHGVVLNQATTFGDSTMHMIDEDAAIRAINLRFNLPFAPGDTIDLLGTRRLRDGQPAIDPLTAIPRGGGLNPPPIELNTATAATAGDGDRDAAFVVIRNAEIRDTVTTFDGLVLTVDDGSGPLTVLLTVYQNFGAPALYAPGVRITSAAGLLVPDPDTSSWILKPRMRNDIVVPLPPPPPPPTAARHAPHS
jgi:hypothetical protein